MISLLWILALILEFLHCLSAGPITNRTIKEVHRLKNFSCEPHQIVYSYSDAPGGCEREALRCLTNQLNATTKNCFMKNTRAFKLSSRVQAIFHAIPDTTNSICAWTCKETNQTRDFLQFVEDLLEGLYKLSSAKSTLEEENNKKKPRFR